jgi:hypothetical protein
VVWNDSNQFIEGAQVSGDGSSVRPIAPISADVGGFHFRPDVAWNGSSYLVVYEVFFAGSSDPSKVLARRVSAAGFLKGGSFQVSTATGAQLSPAVAAAGSTFLVTWADSRSGNQDIYGGRVSASGDLLDGVGVPLASDSAPEAEPDLAWNGSNFFVTYTRTGTSADVYGRLINASAVPVGAPVPVSSLDSSQSQPAVASNGSGFMVVWADTRNSTLPDIYASRVDGSGTVLDVNGIAVATVTGEQDEPAIAFNGTYLTAWRDVRNGARIYAARLASSGAVQDPGGFQVSTTPWGSSNPALARATGSERWAIVHLSGNSPNNSTDVIHRFVSSK